MSDDFIILDLLKLLGGVLGILAVVGTYRRAKRGYVRLPYQAHSRSASEAWRWRQPDESKALNQRSDEDQHGLRVEDGSESSRLHIPLRVFSFEKGGVLFGYVGLGFCVWLLVVMLINGRPLPMYLIVLVFAWLSWLMLHLGSRVVLIEMKPDRVVFILRYGFRLNRKAVFYRKTKKLNFEGRIESVLEMTIDHDQPDFKLFVIYRGWLFKKKQRFILSVNRTQGEWLIEGLQQWLLNTEDGLHASKLGVRR